MENRADLGKARIETAARIFKPPQCPSRRQNTALELARNHRHREVLVTQRIVEMAESVKTGVRLLMTFFGLAFNDSAIFLAQRDVARRARTHARQFIIA